MSALKDVLARAEHWTASAQDDLLQAALLIEESQAIGFQDLDEEDYKIIEQRMQESRAGKFATEDEVEAVFAKYRLP